MRQLLCGLVCQRSGWHNFSSWVSVSLSRVARAPARCRATELHLHFPGPGQRLRKINSRSRSSMQVCSALRASRSLVFSAGIGAVCWSRRRLPRCRGRARTGAVGQRDLAGVGEAAVSPLSPSPCLQGGDQRTCGMTCGRHGACVAQGQQVAELLRRGQQLGHRLPAELLGDAPALRGYPDSQRRKPPQWAQEAR